MAGEGNGPAVAELGLTEKDLGLVSEQKLPPTPKKPPANPVNPETRQAIRQFTKSTAEGRGVRSKTAQQLVTERRNIQNINTQTRSTDTQRETVRTSIDERDQKLEQLDQQIEVLAGKLESRGASLFKRVRDKIAPGVSQSLHRTQAESLANKEALGVSQQEAYSEFQALGLELQRLQQLRAGLRNPKDLLSNFYKEQGWKLQATENLKALEGYKNTHGQVEEVARRYGAYLTHGISTHNKVSTWFNSAVRSESSWKDKLAINVVEGVPLACRAVKPGDGERDLFSGIGIIINSGKIEEASATSLESYVTPDGKRVASNMRARTIEEYEKGLRGAVDSPHWTSEIIIDKPKVAGLFINLDDINVVNGKYFSGDEQVNIKDLMEVASQYGMKVFGFKGGEAHILSLNPKTGETVMGPVVSPEDMLSQTFEIPEENKPAITHQAKSSLSNNGNY